MNETVIILAYFLGMFTLLALQIALNARASLKELEVQLEKEKTENSRRKKKLPDPGCR